MTYLVSNNRTIISGQTGIYDNKIKSSDVRYGRNATNNYFEYSKDLARQDNRPPLEFEYRYVPDGKYSTLALMGNAYEELGQKSEVSVEELNKKFEDFNKQVVKNPEMELRADALDINNDGKVDIAEYATSTLATDMLDNITDKSAPTVKDVDGVITNKGENASLKLYMKNNVQPAKQIFTNLYNTFNLNSAMNEFKSNQNNYS